MSIDAGAPGHAALTALLASDPGGVLEDLAVRHGVTLREALDCLPVESRSAVAGTHFGEIMADVTGWGEVTLLVNTGDVILECKGVLPSGRFGRGYYNLDGGPVGGHLRADRCAAIYFVRRPFMGHDSQALWFINHDGQAMFKIFLGRNPDRSLKADQVRRFRDLRDRLEP